MPRSAAMAPVAAAAVCILLSLLTGCTGQSLEILPSQKHQKIAVHKSSVLTCQPNVPDINLVSDLQWKDPRGFVINPATPRGPRPEMYTELMTDTQKLMLYITSITVAMAGNYTCVASYAVSEHLSASVWIDTYVSITWVNAPENQFATKGKDFKMMCEVAAEPSPAVDWFKDGLPLVNDDRHVIHANGLQINSVEESDDGTYTCRAVVIQTGELQERNIKLEVFIAPEMQRPVQDIVKIKQGESASITCKATGKPPPTYAWIKDSTKENLGLPGSRFSVTDNEGVLRINQVEASDYGKYSCHAVNRAGQSEIGYVIEVVVPPRVERLENVTFSAQKEEARLVCRATGRPAPDIVFRKLSSDTPYVLGSQPDDDRITLETSNRPEGDQFRSTGVLSIANLNRTDDGLYECIASNEGGEGRRNGHIQVKFAPSFENMPTEPVWSWGGRPANLSCLAESIPNATIKWRWQNRDLVETNHIRIYGSSAFSYLTISPTDDSLFGVYKCIATNSEGEAEHSIQFLRAYVPGPVQQVTTESITATSVRFGIIPPAEQLGPPVLALVAQYKEADNFDFAYARNRTWSVPSPYVVEGLRSLSTYHFRFAAVNRVGQGAWGGVVTVNMPRRSVPEQPKWRSLVTPFSLTHGVYADRYELSWKVPADNGEPIDGYLVTFCQVRKVNGVWQNVTGTACRNEETSVQAINYEIRNLKPDTQYQIMLRAHNLLGLSLPAELFVQTAPGVDSPGFHRPAALSSSAIVGAAVGGVLVCLLLLDLVLYCTKKQGLLATLCGKRAKKHDDDEAKLGSNKSPDGRVAPPSPAPLPPPVKLVSTPTYVPTTPVDEKEPLKESQPMMDDLKRNTSVEFDGHRVYATTGPAIIGKNSAV